MPATKQPSRSGSTAASPPTAEVPLSPDEQRLWSLLAVVQSGEVRRDRLGTPPARFLAMPLNGQVFGRNVVADVYGCNPFRYLAVSASAEKAELDAAASRLITIGRFRPDAVRAAFVKTGYDGHLPPVDPLEGLERLHDPLQRLLYEVFWPHYDGTALELVRQDRHLVSRRAMQAQLRRIENGDRRAGSLAKHTLAVTYHNLAIALELACATGHAEASPKFWNMALGYWSDVLAGGEFWGYLHERVDLLDDPRLQHEDVDTLRNHLPGMLLGFNRLFARAYAEQGEITACNRQLRIIAESRFPKSDRSEALIAAVQTVTSSRLEPLLQWAEDPTNHCDGKFVGSGQEQEKWSRQEFARLYDPIVDRAMELRRFLKDDLKLAENLVAQTEFDRLCEILVSAVNTRIDYDNDDRPRSILYSILVAKRLLQLPVSESQRRQLEKGIRDDTQLLYRGCGDASKSPDPSRCWFLDDEPADPDESVHFPLYKITEVRGASVRWETRHILVPRSKRAAAVHRREMSAADVAVSRNDPASRRLRGEIDKLQAECDAAVAGIEADCEQKMTREQAACQARIHAYNARVASQEQQDQAAVQRIEDELARSLAAEKQRCAGECARVRAEHQGGIDQAQKEFQARHRFYQGWSGILRIELPTATACMPLCLGLFAVAKTLGWLPFSGTPLLLIGLAAGAGVTWGVSRIVYAAVLRNVRQPLTKKERARDRAIEAVRATSQNTAASRTKQAKEQASQPGSRLQAIQSQRAAIVQAGDAETTRLRNESRQRVDQLRRQDGKKIAALKQQLADRLQLKPESASSQFPPYRSAKSDGYQDGREPPDSEVNRIVHREFDAFVQSLDEIDRLMLGKMHESLPTEQFLEFVAHLMSLSSSERRQVLREMRQRLFGF